MTVRRLSLRHAVRNTLATTFVGAAALATTQCADPEKGQGSGVTGGSSSGGTSGGSGASGGSAGGANSGGTGAGINIDSGVGPVDYGTDAFYKDDPPPMMCNGNMNTPPAPGGTPECPSDKNYAGCPCSPVGTMAACWPGLRRHRNKGACKDGMAECIQAGESKFVWGPCEGYAGISPPTFEPPAGAVGAAACGCFSAGFWKLENLSPCFYSSGASGPVSFAVSTVDDGTGMYQCPQGLTGPTLPPSDFSPNTVRSDCQGQFKLCLTLKAYDAAPPNNMPKATDCVMTQICTEGYYEFDPANVPPYPDLPFPNLPAWVTDDPAEVACAQKFVDIGGYAELDVVGESDECEKVEKVFQRINYCPLKCNDPAHAMDPECINCTNGGGGPF